ncbi:MAG: hypothetical protein Tsb0018_07610 [Opitutales bacterium]|tara:strand:+ start:78 stop:830 length:753 start_codon:yes stop_codon:yes gene_type:complete
MKAYAIKHWERFYENSQSKRAKNLNYALIPHEHTQGAYEHILARQDGVELIGIWHLLLVQASKCAQRGLFADTTGPISPARLAKRMNIGEARLRYALSIFMSSEIGLIDEVDSPKQILLSGRSTLSSRKNGKQREAIEIHHKEDSPELYFEPVLHMVDHDGTLVIEDHLPDFLLPPTPRKRKQAHSSLPEEVTSLLNTLLERVNTLEGNLDNVVDHLTSNTEDAYEEGDTQYELNTPTSTNSPPQEAASW